MAKIYIIQTSTETDYFNNIIKVFSTIEKALIFAEKLYNEYSPDYKLNIDNSNIKFDHTGKCSLICCSWFRMDVLKRIIN